ncbi:MAG: radical SAM protein [Clostridia bacterium]|nr:radical SAM protein [Clostridia bacterium]
MTNRRTGTPARRWSHVYVEREVAGTPECEAILKKLPDATVIPIDHYKDVFNRRKQQYAVQHRSQALILAAKHGTLVYEGSPNCQDFGNAHFYYTSCLMNCPFDCEYCYLKGMYPSVNLVLFLNLTDIFQEVESLLQQYPVYLCISYDTDLLALERLTGMVQRWISFADSHPDLTIEVRTKSAYSGRFCKEDLLVDHSNVIFAYTLSPDPVIRNCEHGTASLNARLQAARSRMEEGYPVRLCFDPMILLPDWKTRYHDMVETVRNEIDLSAVKDISIGTFRIAPDYLKALRRAQPESAVVQYPFVTEHGVCSYGAARSQEMELFLIRELEPEVSPEHIFLWKEDQP